MSESKTAPAPTTSSRKYPFDRPFVRVLYVLSKSSKAEVSTPVLLSQYLSYEDPPNLPERGLRIALTRAVRLGLVEETSAGWGLTDKGTKWTQKFFNDQSKVFHTPFKSDWDSRFGLYLSDMIVRCLEADPDKVFTYSELAASTTMSEASVKRALSVRKYGDKVFPDLVNSGAVQFLETDLVKLGPTPREGYPNPEGWLSDEEDEDDYSPVVDKKIVSCCGKPWNLEGAGPYGRVCSICTAIYHFLTGEEHHIVYSDQAFLQQGSSGRPGMESNGGFEITCEFHEWAYGYKNQFRTRGGHLEMPFRCASEQSPNRVPLRNFQKLLQEAHQRQIKLAKAVANGKATKIPALAYVIWSEDGTFQTWVTKRPGFVKEWTEINHRKRKEVQAFIKETNSLRERASWYSPPTPKSLSKLPPVETLDPPLQGKLQVLMEPTTPEPPVQETTLESTTQEVVAIQKPPVQAAAPKSVPVSSKINGASRVDKEPCPLCEEVKVQKFSPEEIEVLSDLKTLSSFLGVSLKELLKPVFEEGRAQARAKLERLKEMEAARHRAAAHTLAKDEAALAKLKL
jgi:hypothetical protein